MENILWRKMLNSYSSRAALHSNPTAVRLLTLMEQKKTNLSVAVDVTSKAELLHLANILGPYICILKTHIDIIEDFDLNLVQELQRLAIHHDFLIFEDRKFADIGNTVKLQYSKGIYKIADWADITNAHPIPGEGIVSGLKEIGLPKGRGLLLLAEMSSAGSLAVGSYSIEAVKMAIRNTDFCIGFIGQNRIDLANLIDAGMKTDFIYMTPGVALVAKGDSLGQQYRTPRQVIIEGDSDVIIVGRGIYGAGDVAENAKSYREAGWQAYLEKLK